MSLSSSLVLTDEQYHFNYRHFDLFEMYRQGYLATIQNRILITERLENFNHSKYQLRGVYVDVLGFLSGLRDLEGEADLENPKLIGRLLVRKEAFLTFSSIPSLICFSFNT